MNGNGTRSDVLRLAGVARARAVVIATSRDDAAVLVALTARQLTPAVVELVEDLLTPETGLAIAQRPVEPGEVGGSPRHLPDIVLGVVREGRLYRVDAPEVDAVEAGDVLLYVRKVTPPGSRG